MSKENRILFTVTGILTLLLTAAAVLFGMYLHAESLAGIDVAEATSKIAAENEQLTSKRDILKKDVDSKTDDTDLKNELNKEITDLTGQIAAMKTDIDTAKKSLKDTKAHTESADKALEALKSGMNLSRGDSVVMEENALLICPDSIKPGRYIAEGDGVLTITAANGSARVSEDLLTIDTGTYTFDLADGESVETQNGGITLTELK